MQYIYAYVEATAFGGDMEPMKVKLGALELEVTSIEQLKELAQAFGAESLKRDGAGAPSSHHVQHGHAAHVGHPGHQDMTLLKKFIEAGATGIEASHVGTILGKKGKGMRPAIRAWSKRMSLIQDGVTDDAFEAKRVGNKRGFRIKPALLDVAKSIASGGR